MKNAIKKTIAIIPARLHSTRLPEKLILDLAGVPLIIRTCQAISNSKYIDEVVVAVDSPKLQTICEQYGYKSIMTDENINSGSDRIYAAYQKLEKDYTYIINVQGDEPLIKAEDLDNLIEQFEKSKCDVGTIYKKISDINQLKSSDNVKVIFNERGEAIYFSRSIIPFLRDINPDEYLEKHDFFKHIGIYIYTEKSLSAFVSLEQSNLEKAEKLEQLRLIENGYKIFCCETKNEIHGVDTQDDYEYVKKMFEKCGKSGTHN